MPIQQITHSETSLGVTVEETLTTEDVKSIAAALSRRPKSAVTTIDLRRVRACEPPALLMLSRLLAAAGAPYALVGLTSADQRLLRYLEPTGAGATDLPAAGLAPVARRA